MRNIITPYKQDDKIQFCCSIDELEIVGTGGYDRKGKTTKGKFYDAYWCPKCKRMYIDCHFHGHHGYGRGPYSPRATREHLKQLNKVKEYEF